MSTSAEHSRQRAIHAPRDLLLVRYNPRVNGITAEEMSEVVETYLRSHPDFDLRVWPDSTASAVEIDRLAFLSRVTLRDDEVDSKREPQTSTAGAHSQVSTFEPTALPEPTVMEKRLTGATLDLASFIAAGAREQARKEWIAEQRAGDDGELRSAVERLRFSLGLVHAAVLIRSARISDPFVNGLDKIARSEPRTRLAIAIVEIAMALYVFHGQGLAGVIADGESLISIGGTVYAGARWRRKVLRDRDAIAGVSSDGE